MARAKKSGRRKRPAQERSQHVVSAIVEGAIQLLESVERERFSVNDIAVRAGVGIGSLYRYFSGREGVMDAVVDRITVANFERFEQVLDTHEEGLLELFDALIDTLFDTYTKSPALTRTAILTILTFDRLPAITRERDRFVKKLAARIARELNMEPAEVEPLAVATVDMSLGVVVSNVYRGAGEEALQRAKEVVQRASWAELNRLVNR